MRWALPHAPRSPHPSPHPAIAHQQPCRAQVAACLPPPPQEAPPRPLLPRRAPPLDGLLALPSGGLCGREPEPAGWGGPWQRGY